MGSLLMTFLMLIHWVVGFVLLFPMFIQNKKIKLISYFAIAAVLASWIIFDGCVIWDIQKMIDPSFVISGDTLGNKIGMSNKKWAYINAILTYTNLIVLGYQLDRLQEALTIMIIYMSLNGEILTKPFVKILSDPSD